MMASPDFSLVKKRSTCPCTDTTWTATGEERCVGTAVEQEELSNCGTPRWVQARQQTWTPTGQTRCQGTNVEAEERNDCGATRWTTQGPQTWTPTGQTRCVNHLTEYEERNDCGRLRWTSTTQKCGYCPSLRLSCDGSIAGYGYHIADPKDPDATVEMAPCADDTSVDSVWIYATAGEGHTIKVSDCDGNIIGYAANKSACAPDCPCGPQTVNVAAPEVTAVNNVTLPAPNVVAASFDQNGELTITRSDATTVTAQIPTCED